MELQTETLLPVEERRLLIDELQVLQTKAQEFGISGNRDYYSRGLIDKDLFTAYKANSKKILEVEKRIRALNQVIKRQDESQNNDKETIKQILKESLSNSDYLSFMQELKNRQRGGFPMKVRFSMSDNSFEKEKIVQLKNIAADLSDKLLATRQKIDRYILENEPDINKASYFKSVASLNKSCTPQREILKIKETIERVL